VRKHRQILIALACVTALLGIAAFLSRDRQPWYEGRSYADWLAAYDLDCRQSEDADDPHTPAYWALRHIGTNAIPTLLKWVAHEPQPLRLRFHRLAEKLPGFVANSPIIERLSRDPYPGARPYNCYLAFFVLGSNANCAIPALSRLMNDPSAEYDGCDAAISLAEIGPAALPPLMSAAANPQARCRTAAISALSQMKSNALPAVPLLVQCLASTNQIVACAAAYSLCSLRLRPDIVFPILTNHLHSLDPDARVAAAEWLGEFETHRPLARSLLLAALNDPSEDVRSSAANALDKVAPDVLTNAPAQ
jgi:hypothetical protein